MRRRLRGFESLEARRLLTATISEVLYDPLFGDADTEQYVELRGPAGSQLADGTYLAVVESAESINGEEGQIHGLFDLSGLSFGSNGFLVLLPQNSPFSSDPAANTLISTAPGFGGLPGDIYQDSHDLSDRIDFIYASNTYFLFQSDVVPQLGDDIDVNSDGLIDVSGVFQNWNVMDSVSTMWGLSDGHGYGDIVFVDVLGFDPIVTLQPTSVRVNVEGSGYIGRVGNSTGSRPVDWAAGTVKDESDDDLFYRLSGDIHGRPWPTFLHGRELDHVGSENFVGAVRAGFFEDTNGNDQWDAGEPVIGGTRVLADTNGNGTQDSLEFVIEPDLWPEDTELNNLTPGVSITTGVDDNVIVGFDITNRQEAFAPTGQYIFAHAGVGFFNTTRRLRMDFYRPADSVSIDVIGNSNQTPTYGRLEVYDADGNSLEMIRTGPLGADQRVTLSIDRSTDDIAYAVAYSDDDYLDSSPFGKLDTLRFTVPEAVAESDSEGLATLNYLDPDAYAIVPVPGGTSGYIFDPVQVNISEYENFEFSIPVRLNEAPEFLPADLEIEENSAGGTLVGVIEATDDPTQTVRYSLVQGNAWFTIGATSGELRLRSGVTMDYEGNPQRTIRVRATDNAEIPMSAEQEFTVDVLNVNEPPTIGDFQFSVTENAPQGTYIGTVQGSDEDLGFDGLIGYRIVGQNLLDAVAINGLTGELTVNNPAVFDHEARTQLVVQVQVFDSGSPPLADQGNVTITIGNANEPPKILTNELAVGELAAPGDAVGAIVVTDADSGQTHTFGWADGFDTDLFSLDAVSGQLTIAPGASLDYASAPEHFVSVRVTDSGEPAESTEKQVRIRVIDENNPPEIQPANLTVIEGQTDVVAGTVTVTDPDEGQQHIFAIVGGTGEYQFTIDRWTGEVRLRPGVEMDYETTPSVTLEVQAWDTGEPTQTSGRTFTVTVENVNEPPTVDVSPISVAENTVPGTVIGQIITSDPDGDVVQLEWVETADSGAFSLDVATGEISVATGAMLNFETQNEYVLTVRGTDGQIAEPIERQFTVTIEDVNDPPVVVGELDPVSGVAGMSITATADASVVIDEDVDQTLTWALEMADGSSVPSWLQFDPQTLQLDAFAWNADAGDYPLRLVATDSGTPEASATVGWLLTIEENATPWTNIAEPFDVNGDGEVKPIDALVIINYLNRSSQTDIPLDIDYRPNFLDVTGNNRVEPRDALRVINALNRQSGGEGEWDGSTAAGVDLVGDASAWLESQPSTVAQGSWDLGLLSWLHEDEDAA